MPGSALESLHIPSGDFYFAGEETELMEAQDHMAFPCEPQCAKMLFLMVLIYFGFLGWLFV